MTTRPMLTKRRYVYLLSSNFVLFCDAHDVVLVCFCCWDDRKMFLVMVKKRKSFKKETVILAKKK